MARLPIFGFDHLSLICRRPAATLTFYTKVLGFRVAARMPHIGMTELVSGGAALVLINTVAKNGAWAVSERGPGENVHHCCLRLASFDEPRLRAALKKARIDIEEEQQDDGEAAFYIRDPEGNCVELRGKRVRGRNGLGSSKAR